MTARRFFACCAACAAVCTLLVNCAPRPGPKINPTAIIQKVIVTDFGETTRNSSYRGERIKYRIYYANLARTKSDVYVVDRLAPGLADIIVADDGRLDKATDTILWKISGVLPEHGGFVEFSAELGDVGHVTNQALVALDQPPRLGSGEPLARGVDRNRGILTNQVETTVCDPPEVGWIPFASRARPGAQPAVAMKNETTTDILLNFDIPGMYVWEQWTEGTLYHRLSIPRTSNLDRVGRPEVPIVGRVVEIPPGVDISVEIYKSQSRVLDCYNVFPAQKPEPEQQGARVLRPVGRDTSFVVDPQVYLRDSYFPVKQAAFELEDIGTIRGHRVVFLKVNPVQFNPVTRELRVYSQVEVRLRYDRPAQIQTIPRRLYSEPIEQMLSGVIANYRPHDALLEYSGTWPDEADEETNKMGCDYLIISEDGFYDQSDPNNAVLEFANWKRAKGYSVRVSKISDIGNTEADIIDYINRAYHDWSNPPTYVLLLGDANHITPVYRTEHPWDGHWDDSGNRTLVGTDLYYAAVDGADYFPDLFLGRISVDNAAEAATVLNKIMDYEQNPTNNQNYYTNTPLVRLFEDDSERPPGGIVGDGQEDRFWVLIERAEEMRNHLIGEGYTVERIYNWSGNTVGGPLRWENGANLPNHLTFAQPTTFLWDGDTNDIVNAVNAGRFLVSYRGHGNRNGWGNPRFRTWNVNQLTNSGELALFWGPTCMAGWFDDETDHVDLNTSNDSFSEEILRHGNGGAVAAVAHCRASWGSANNPATEGMCDAFWPNYDTSLSPVRLSRIGQVANYSKIYMANHLAAGGTRLLSFEMQHLLGDPELPIWTEAPEQFELDYPAAIGSSGQQDFVVAVRNRANREPVNMAMVTLSRSGQLLARHQTDAFGFARFAVYPVSTADIELTVTKPDFAPAQEVIAVTQGGAEINVLSPDNGAEHQDFDIGGRGYQGAELVDIRFGNETPQSATAAGGEFGQAGTTAVTMTVPTGYALGPVNIVAEGQTSSRKAVDVFTVRTTNPIDLYTYCQWDATTHHLAGGQLTWDNPEIQLFDSGNNPVNSNDLVAGRPYTVRAKIHNPTAYDANRVRVTFQWANFGVGQPDRVWEPIGEDTIDVAHGSVENGEASWTPPGTGHLCIMVRIAHLEDINSANNYGQENCDVGPTSSPRQVRFTVWNPTDASRAVYLVVRQHTESTPGEPVPLWLTTIEHPDPQVLRPGERGSASIILDPTPAKPRPGTMTEFSVDGYIGDLLIGGASFKVRVK